METLQIKADNEPIKIRGHHLKFLLRKTPRQKLARDLVGAEYVSSTKHPFVDFVFNLPFLLTDPTRKFVIVANEIDYVCSSCPILKERRGRACFGRLHQEADEYEAKRFGLEVGKKYSTKELLEHLSRTN